MTPGSLAGVRVLDISPLLPGPFATQMLADLGAVVIKVEKPTGDPSRRLPGQLHESANRNKRSIVLDLTSEVDRRHCLRLAATADIFVQGFRPDVVDRLGMSFRELRMTNPGLVYCSISGFGQTGPKRQDSGHDVTYLAAAGALAFTGNWSDQRPRRSGIPVADLAAATYLAVAICAALYDRTRTGIGCHLDLAIADAALAFASVRAGQVLRNEPSERLHLNPSNDLFETADGMIAVGAVEEHFWERLRVVLAKFEPALADSRFDHLEGRLTHGDQLAEMLRTTFVKRSTQYWCQILSATDVPVEKVRPLSEAVDSAQVRSRRVVQALDGQRHVTFPVLIDGEPMGRFRSVAPGVGSDSAAIIDALDHGGNPWAMEVFQ